MAKQQDGKFSFSDFEEDNLLDANPDPDTPNPDEDEEDENLEPDEGGKAKVKKKEPKKPKASDEPDPDNDEDEDPDEDEDQTKNKTKVKKKPEPSPDPDPEPNPDDENQDDGPTPEQFFEEVDKLTGFELEVEYGDVDPLTPQGVAIREKTLRQAAVDGYLTELEERYPQAFRALLHAANGGDPAELFTSTSARDYSKVEIGEKDNALATEILKEFYRSKGVKNEEKLKRMLLADEESEAGLIGEAKAALDELKAEQKQKEDEVFEEQKRKAAEQKKRDTLMIAAVDEVLNTGKLSNFKIPTRQEAAEFKKFVLSSLRRAGDGKYEFTTPVDSTNLEKLLQYQYFQFKKGDLGKLIEIKASTKKAEELKLRIKQENNGVKKNSGTGNTGTSGSLRDFDI